MEFARLFLVLTKRNLGLASIFSIVILFVGVGSSNAIPTKNYEVTASPELAAQLLKASQLTQLMGKITPPLQTPRTRSNLYITNCHLMVFDNKYGNCVFGDKSAEKSIFLFGDSHGAQWFPALEDIANKYHYKLYAMTKSACGISTVVPKMGRLGGKPYVGCAKAQDKIIKRIATVKPDLVVLASRLIDEKGPRSKAWFDGMTEQLKRVKTAANGKVVYLGDTPYPGFEVAQCLLKNSKNVGKCNSSLDSAKQNDLSGPGAKAASDAGVVYISLINWFCSTENCPATLNNILLYIDYSHITTEASKFYSPLVYNEIIKFL